MTLRSHSTMRHPTRVVPTLTLPSERAPSIARAGAPHQSESARHLGAERAAPHFPYLNYRAQTSRLSTYMNTTNVLLQGKRLKRKIKCGEQPDQEMRRLIEELRVSSNRAQTLSKACALVMRSPVAAYELFRFLEDTKWKELRSWYFNEKAPVRRTLLAMLQKMVEYCYWDVKKELNSRIQTTSSVLPEIETKRNALTGITPSLDETSRASVSPRVREPLKNITNRVRQERQNKTAQGIFRETLQEKKKEEGTILFKKDDLLKLIGNAHLYKLLYVHVKHIGIMQDRRMVQNFIELVVNIAMSKTGLQGVEFKHRQMYDCLSMMILNSGIFQPLIGLFTLVEPVEYRTVARVFELCACHQEGIVILNDNIDLVMDLLQRFIKADLEMTSIIYPAATVLLDLTASEICIEKVSQLMKEKQLMEIILKGAHKILFSIDDDLAPKNNRLRDLLVGILLNLTCNVEDEELSKFLIDKGIIKILNRILVDERNDWPSNGSALALLQFCNLAMSDSQLFKELETYGTFATMEGYLPRAQNPDTRRNLKEALSYYQIAMEKRSSISRIIESRFFTPCA